MCYVADLGDYAVALPEQVNREFWQPLARGNVVSILKPDSCL
jgi:hypothetical protein